MKQLPALILSAVISLPARAFAAGGGAMPWEQPLTTIADSLSGPVARSIGLIAVVVAGLAMAFTEGGTILHKFVGIIFGLSIVFAAATFLTTLFGAGGGSAFPYFTG